MTWSKSLSRLLAQGFYWLGDSSQSLLFVLVRTHKGPPSDLWVNLHFSVLSKQPSAPQKGLCATHHISKELTHLNWLWCWIFWFFKEIPNSKVSEPLHGPSSGAYRLVYLLSKGSISNTRVLRLLNIYNQNTNCRSMLGTLILSAEGKTPKASFTAWPDAHMVNPIREQE